MSSKTLDPQKLINEKLRSIAKKNKAKSYSAWLSESTLDPRIGASDALVNAATKYALNKREIGASREAINSGYGKYLADQNRSSYLGAKAAANQELEKKTQQSLAGYQSYVEALDKKRRELMDTTHKSILNLGITDISDAYRRAKNSGLSESDARAVAKDATSVTRTELFQKAVSTIISKYYTAHQAQEYALALGLPRKDAEELGKIAGILNQLTSNQKYYSGDYTQYIEGLKNTIK